MTTTFVLLALLTTWSPRQVTWVAEFSSQERCESAGNMLVQAARRAGTVTFVCAPK